MRVIEVSITLNKLLAVWPLTVWPKSSVKRALTIWVLSVSIIFEKTEICEREGDGETRDRKEGQDLGCLEEGRVMQGFPLYRRFMLLSRSSQWSSK